MIIEAHDRCGDCQIEWGMWFYNRGVTTRVLLERLGFGCICCALVLEGQFGGAPSQAQERPLGPVTQIG